jgi:hypothetical protein
MNGFDQVLLVLHFLGLAMGLSASLTGLVAGRIIQSAAPSERAAVARVPTAMSHVGGAGLVLLWVSGLALVFSRWGGFGSLPGTFHAKLTAVVVLTGLVGYVHALQKRARLGDATAPVRLALVGKVNLVVAVAAIVLAVLTFD